MGIMESWNEYADTNLKQNCERLDKQEMKLRTACGDARAARKPRYCVALHCDQVREGEGVLLGFLLFLV